MAPREPRCAQDGAAALLAGAIRYALGVCALVAPAEMSLPTPCPQWDLSMLLAHLSDSMADLEAAIRTGRLSVDPRDAASGDPGGDPAGDLGGDPAGDPGGDPVEVLRDRAAELLCSAYGFGGPERLVVVGGLPMPAGLVACTGAVEIAVHGWDVSAARARASSGSASPGRGTSQIPIPAALATRMLRLSPLLVAGREGLFAVPVEVPAHASPGDRLISYLGRHPGAAA